MAFCTMVITWNGTTLIITHVTAHHWVIEETCRANWHDRYMICLLLAIT